MTLTEAEISAAVNARVMALVANHNGIAAGERAQIAVAEKGMRLAREWQMLDPAERPSIESYLAATLGDHDICDAIRKHQNPYA